MRIRIITDENKNINIVIPLGLVFNRLTSRIGSYYVNKYSDVHIDGNQIYELFQVLKQSKKVFGNYTFVDIESSDGEKIKIEI